MSDSLIKNSEQELIQIGQEIIEFSEHLINDLDSRSDRELDILLDFSCRSDEAVWLIRARIFDEKLKRARAGGVKITPNKLAVELAGRYGRNKDTWLLDWRLMKNFQADFFYLLPKEIYKLISKQPARLRNDLLTEATNQRAKNSFSLKDFSGHCRREAKKYKRSRIKKERDGVLISEFISQTAYENLKKLVRGPGKASISGFVTKRQALEAAINEAAYQMMQRDARNLNLDVTDVEKIREEKKESLYI